MPLWKQHETQLLVPCVTTVVGLPRMVFPCAIITISVWRHRSSLLWIDTFNRILPNSTHRLPYRRNRSSLSWIVIFSRAQFNNMHKCQPKQRLKCPMYPLDIPVFTQLEEVSP